MSKKEKVALITAENLIADDYSVHREEPSVVFKKENIYITETIQWQICDEDGNVGNEYIETMDELHEKELINI